MKTKQSKAGMAGLGLIMMALLPFNAAGASRPNIVLLLADDVGWTDLGCYGSTYYETPHLDRLCREGMKFTDAYSAAANCAPSRACLVTGQYVPRHGVYTVGTRHEFDRGEVDFFGRPRSGPNWDERILLMPENAKGIGTDRETIGTAMQQAGYKTGYFGKWHMGWGGTVGIGGYEEEVRGFDEVMLNSSAKHLGFKIWPQPAQPIPPDTYLSDYLTDHALQFVETHRQEPFFLILADFLVHVPETAKEPLVQKYKNKSASGKQKSPVYAAMMESLDHSYGRVLDKLDALGLSENTLVVFTSDNGGDFRTSNVPLRGNKTQYLEGGIRVPAIARWPGRIKPGSTCGVPISGIDLFPTFAATAKSPVNKQNYLLDGEDLTPLFEGRIQAFPTRDLFWYVPGYLGHQGPVAVIRSGDDKLLHYFEDDHLALYDLRGDIGETKNLVRTQPEKASALKARLDQWREQTGASIPPRNPTPKEGVFTAGR